MSIGHFTRRQFVQFSALTMSSAIMPNALADTATMKNIKQGLQESDLIYLTPIKNNGSQSQCQSEIWFVWDRIDIFVCTMTSSWRATAPTLGLSKTKIWVGDLGVWSRTAGKYKQLPSITAEAKLIENKATQEKSLAMFAEKYPIGWLRWGNKFKDGLSSGERSLIRYRPLSI